MNQTFNSQFKIMRLMLILRYWFLRSHLSEIRNIWSFSNCLSKEEKLFLFVTCTVFPTFRNSSRYFFVCRSFFPWVWFFPISNSCFQHKYKRILCNTASQMSLFPTSNRRLAWFTGPHSGPYYERQFPFGSMVIIIIKIPPIFRKYSSPK